MLDVCSMRLQRILVLVFSCAFLLFYMNWEREVVIIQDDVIHEECSEEATKELNETVPTRAGVCITGQLERLVLDPHIFRNLYGPLQEYFGALDIVFLLSEGTTFKTNGAGFKGQFDKEALLEAMSHHQCGPNEEFCHVYYKNIEQPKNPVVNDKYVDALLKHWPNTAKGETTRKAQVERASNHVRAFDKIMNCYDYFHELEVANKQEYTVLIRMREDLGFPIKLDIDAIMNEMKPHSVITKKGESWRGVNDHFAMIRREDAFAYFYAPLRMMYVHGNELPDYIENPETLLKAAYENAGLDTSIQLSDKLLFFVRVGTECDKVCYRVAREFIRLEENMQLDGNTGVWTHDGVQSQLCYSSCWHAKDDPPYCKQPKDKNWTCPN